MTQKEINTLFEITISIHTDKWFGDNINKQVRRDIAEVQKWVAEKLIEYGWVKLKKKINNMKAVYKLHFDCGRMGELTGLFVAEQEKMNALIQSGEEVYFGEVLGKHSEVCGPIEEDDVSLISTDENVIKVIEEHGLENGFNPFDYIANDEDNE